MRTDSAIDHPATVQNVTYHPRHWIAVPGRGVALALILLLIGCSVSKSPVTGDTRLYGYSWEREVEIGRQVDEQIVAQFGLYEDAETTSYVKAVGQDVLAHSHMRGPDVEEQFRTSDFTFRVLDSPVVNAFALPGGYIYVTRGLMAYLENEAQLAVVLGHEIGHVAARHASQQALSQRVSQIGLIGGAILGQEFLGIPAGDFMQLGQQAAQLLQLSYSRDDERESDHLGVEYAVKAGYRASEGSGFFSVLERLGDQGEGGLPTFLSTHPDPGQREQRIKELALTYSTNPDTLEIGREPYYEHLAGLVWGDDPRAGFRDEGTYVVPNRGYQFPAPVDWNATKSGADVFLVEPDQRAIVMISRLEEPSDPETAAREFLSHEQIEPVTLREEKIDGRPAALAAGRIQSEGTVYRLLATFVQWDERVVRLLGYTTDEQYSRYRSQFEQILFGLSDIVDPANRAPDPYRIRIWRTEREGIFETIVPTKGIPMELPELAILNQRDLNASVPTGTMVKLPRKP